MAAEIAVNKAPVAGSSLGTILCVIGGIVLLIFGMVSLTDATTGVGVIGMACFVAICGRILQASAHHKMLMRSRQ